ncbi:unnamed protein product [Musa banksii]
MFEAYIREKMLNVTYSFLSLTHCFVSLIGVNTSMTIPMG